MQIQRQSPSPQSKQRTLPVAAWVGACWLALCSAPLASAAVDPASPRSTSLPASDLFQGDQLSDRTKARLGELMRGLQGTSIELAVMVPTGPWLSERTGRAERELSAARRDALRSFLAERGIAAGRVFMESGLDEGQQELRLDLQLMPRAGP